MSRSKARKFADLVKFFDIDYTRDRATMVKKSADVRVSATGQTLEEGDVFFVSTATQTVTLPASPLEGDQVSVIVGDFTDTTLARNGSRIMGLEEDLIIDSANIGLELVYTDATNGWRIL